MKTVCVLFGGESTEYNISCISARNILNVLDEQEYNVYALGITEEGEWLLYNSKLSEFNEKTWFDFAVKAFISPVKRHHGIICKNGVIKIDVFIVAMHGRYGEDGAIQGLLNLSGIPYVGSPINASSIGYDKRLFKMIVNNTNMLQPKWFYIGMEYLDNRKVELIDRRIKKEISYPVFVKPSRGGSSLGVALCDDVGDLVEALETAIKYDSNIIIEQKIEGMEVNCAMLSVNDNMDVLSLSNIEHRNHFYDYETKYTKGKAKLIIPANISEETKKIIIKYSKNLCKILNIQGLCRFDYFVEKQTKKVFVNEINTQPGIGSEQSEANAWKLGGSMKNTFSYIIKLILDKEEIWKNKL